MAESFRGCLGIVQITRYGLWAAIDDLAGVAGRKQLAARCHDGDLHVDGWRADRTGMAQLVLGLEECRNRAHLRLPEHKAEVAAEDLDRPAKLGLRHWRHGVDRQAQTTDIAGMCELPFDELLDHH